METIISVLYLIVFAIKKYIKTLINAIMFSQNMGAFDFFVWIAQFDTGYFVHYNNQKTSLVFSSLFGSGKYTGKVKKLLKKALK